jgi:hypothetical protein
MQESRTIISRVLNAVVWVGLILYALGAACVPIDD